MKHGPDWNHNSGPGPSSFFNPQKEDPASLNTCRAIQSTPPNGRANLIEAGQARGERHQPGD